MSKILDLAMKFERESNNALGNIQKQVAHAMNEHEQHLRELLNDAAQKIEQDIIAKEQKASRTISLVFAAPILTALALIALVLAVATAGSAWYLKMQISEAMKWRHSAELHELSAKRLEFRWCEVGGGKVFMCVKTHHKYRRTDNMAILPIEQK